MDYIIEKNRKHKKSKIYFTKETENAIVEYNNTKSISKRNKIYQDKIHFSFFKLTQNIIHTFKLYNTDIENLEDLQHELEVFLLSKIHLYSPKYKINKKIKKIIGPSYKNDFLKYVGDEIYLSQEDINLFLNNYIYKYPIETHEDLEKIKFPKAYSYFGTAVKRWLILYNEKNYNNKINTSPVIELTKHDDDGFNLNYNKIIEENNFENLESSPQEELSLFIDLFVDYCTLNLNKLFPKEEDAKIADVLLELFRKRDQIDIFNKKALYIYIREMVDVKTPKITKISSKLKKVFNNSYKTYIETGVSPFVS